MVVKTSSLATKQGKQQTSFSEYIHLVRVDKRLGVDSSEAIDF